MLLFSSVLSKCQPHSPVWRLLKDFLLKYIQAEKKRVPIVHILAYQTAFVGLSEHREL